MHTCWLEQLTNYVYKHCKCKDFFMPGTCPFGFFLFFCFFSAAFFCISPVICFYVLMLRDSLFKLVLKLDQLALDFRLVVK